MKNSKGTVWYGLHFYPGVAEYSEAGKEPYRVFLNEDTLRAMDPSFAGRPVFVMHVDGVDSDIDELRKEADGWVIDSFYNASDGKHWVRFIAVSERAERAIAQGMRLSNCYEPRAFGRGGLWNGVQYVKEITAGEYEHLAIVPNPRYEESVILSPDDFKAYNEEKNVELKRLANEKGKKPMALKFFKKAKVENAIDLEAMSVVLPKSGKEVTVLELVSNADEHAEKVKKGEPEMANGDHMVEVAGKKMSVNELVAKHQKMCDALDAHKTDDPDESGDPSHGDVELDKGAVEKNGDDTPNDPAPVTGGNSGDEDESDEAPPKKKKSEVMGVRGDKDGHDKTENDDEDEIAKKKALELAEHEEKEIKAEKKKNDKAKADRLRNAPTIDDHAESAVVMVAEDRVALGKSRYGS